MRLLGIDYGEKKIGVAVSDETARFTFPHGVIDNVSAAEVFKEIKKICDDNNVGKIIIGESLTYKMQPNAIMKRINKFKTLLEEKLNLPVEFESEILTTKQAERTIEKPKTGARMKPRKKDEKIHASAAALILQAYLDRKIQSC